MIILKLCQHIGYITVGRLAIKTVYIYNAIITQLSCRLHIDDAINPGVEVMHVGIHTRVHWGGTSIAPAHDTGESPDSTPVRVKGASTVTLASIDATLRLPSAQHIVAVELVGVALGTSVIVLDGLHDLVKLGRTFTSIAEGAPPGHNGGLPTGVRRGGDTCGLDEVGVSGLRGQREDGDVVGERDVAVSAVDRDLGERQHYSVRVVS